MVYFLCAFIFAAPTAVSAVSVDVQNRVIRREAAGAVHLSADGGMVKLQDNDASGPKLEDTQFCPNDYPKGMVKTNDCHTPVGEPFTHVRIMQEAVCRDAATASGGLSHRAPNDFVLNEELYMKRPWGCYASPCDVNNKGPDATCYFWNGSPNAPDDIQSGTPICKRPKFANGTATPNDALNGCPFNYQAIMHELTCWEAGKCLGRTEGGTTPGAGFRIGEKNASEHHDHPIGCFINPYDGEVYYNFVEAGWESPAHPYGVPICNVSETTQWAAGYSHTM